MNKKAAFLLSAFLCAGGMGASLSQTLEKAVKLSFEIRDAGSHEPLSSVICQAFTAEGRLFSYAVADKDGRLSVSAHPSDSLVFSYIGYGKVKKEAASYSPGRTNLVELAEQEVRLREVAVTAPPITAKSDTLVYNMASFARQGDSHLEDVLKKLPGIKVADNGTVSYQGQAINKFYIEGKDLLGSSYNQATRNMPVDAVTAVEILENHQPVKMLQGRQFTDKAALNIRLDKGHKARPFGEAEGGVGGSPALWNNRLFLTQILGGSQLLITGKMNNAGTDISDETQEHLDVTDIDAYEPVPSRLLSPPVRSETLPQNRYLHNKSYSAGANYLTSLSEDATLRVNVLFYEDRSRHSNSYDYAYGGTQSVNISEMNDRRQKTLAVLPIVKYELNSRKTYLSDELRYSFNRSSASNALVSNGAGITEDVSGRPHYLQNYFTASFSLGKQLVQARSFLRCFNGHEALTDLSDSVSFYNAHERYAIQSFVAKNALSTSFRAGRNSLDLSAKAYYRDNGYDHEGSVHHRELRLRFQPAYTVLLGTDRTLSLELPIERLRISLAAPQAGNGSREAFSFAPGLYFRYKLTDKWGFTGSAFISKDNLPADFYSPHALRTAYRAAYVPGSELFFSDSKHLSAGVRYRDLAAMFFASLLVSYTDEKRECYTNYDYTDSLTTVSPVRGDNRRRLFLADATADKSFVDAGVALKSEISYNKTSYLLSQSGVQACNNSNILAVNLNVTWQKLKWLRVAAGVAGAAYWERNSIHNSEVLCSLAADASVYVFPTERMDVKLTCQNHTNEVSKSRFATCSMLDADASYKAGKAWETGVSVTNLLGMKTYTVTQNSGINTSVSSLPLRGREVLFRILLRF